MSSSHLRTGETHHLSEVRIVLLGCKNAGKSSAGNTILGREEFVLQTSAQCVKRHGEVAGRKITLVEAPGWQRNEAVRDSVELLKQEIVLSASMCPPGPHAVLLVLRLDFKLWKSEKNVLEGYLNLLGDEVWSHTVVLFTFGETLRNTSIEQHIESEGEALQWLVKKCGNRYHVFNNNKMNDDSQVKELLEKIEEMVAGNRGCLLEMKTKEVTKMVESKGEDSAAATNTRPVRRPAKMASLIHEGKSGHDFKSTGEGRPEFTATFLKHKQMSNPSVQHSAGVQLFTPELVEKYAEDKNKNEYRFLCSHAGQFKCRVTHLVFEMEGKGEVWYRIASWDKRVLNELHQKAPAGPLYDIDCLKGSIHHLHLPHCETQKDMVELTVAHVTGGNVAIIQPLKVTKTHVIVDIHHLSCFGLLRFLAIGIRAQVLLFYQKCMHKLFIHLVPWNVSVEEVQKRHNSSTYIMTSSKCKLTPGKKYRPWCKTTDRDYVSEPECETFDCDYDPNYHPTFGMDINPEVTKVTLSILDENGQVVWTPRTVMLTGTRRGSPRMDTTGADFVDRYREQLIQRVPSVMEIVDCLKSKNMISDDMYNNISVESTSTQQMRLLYRVLDSGGRAVKAEFYNILGKKQPHLVYDLVSGSSLA